MLNLSDRFNGAEYDLPPFAGEPRIYVIAAVPRSGSTLLARALRATGVAGAPSEYFNSRNITDFRARFGALTMEELRDRLLKLRTTPNGVFGFNLLWNQFEEVFRRGNSVAFRHLIVPSKVVFLYRKDKIRQAVSWARAAQTDQWSSDMQRAAEESYHRGLVHRCLHLAINTENTWRRFFEATHVNPLQISYEELNSDYVGTIVRVSEFIGAQIDANAVPPPPIQKMADQVSEEWAWRFVNESQSEPSK